MIFHTRTRLRIVSLLTAVMFLASTFGVYAQQVVPQQAAPQQQSIDITALLGSNPELSHLQNNIGTIQQTLKQIDQTAIPLYNKIAPSNMEAMTIGQRIKAILSNTKTLVGNGLNSYKAQVGEWDQANGLAGNPSFEQELGVGLNQLGVEAGKMPLNGNGNALIGKLKTIINAIKDKLQNIIRIIRAKIAAVAQKVGLMKKDPEEAKKGADREEEGVQMSMAPEHQYADTFAGKLSKGITEGAENAKTSLKNSFSLTNLAVTTTVAVGTNLAIDMIRGEKPSFKKAVKAVASVEFAGGVVGSALGAAGGQFTATLVKTFIPGPIGAMVGAVIPVLMGSAAGQMGSSLAGDAKNGHFSIKKAWKSIDKVDLIGSSIGSTIGMALGAPIPIIGPIIGGILGGVIGSKVAKLISNFAGPGKLSFAKLNPLNWFKNKGKNLPNMSGSGINVGSVGNGGDSNQGLGMYTGGGSVGGLTPVGNVGAPAAGDLATAEKQYYETYLKYNRLVEDGNQDEAKQVFTELKVYSDRYNSLKKEVKGSN